MRRIMKNMSGMVLQKLCDARFYAKLENCISHQPQVEFLDYTISGEGLSMDPKKIQTIIEWRKPKSIRDVQCFIGFVNLYWYFIQDYTKIAIPLTHLTCKNKLKWNSGANQAFQDFKTAFTMAPILIHLEFSNSFFFEGDAFDYALGMVLSQNEEDEQLHLVAFHSQNFTDVEINYEIHD